MRARTQRDDYRHSRPLYQHGPAMSLLNKRRGPRQVPGIVSQGKVALGQGKVALGQGRVALGQGRVALGQGRFTAICILVVLALFHAAVASADATIQVDALTSTPTESRNVPVPAATTPAPVAQESILQQATLTPTPEAPSTPTPEASATAPAPTLVVSKPTAGTPTPSASPSETAHLAIQVSDCVISVGGTASSEVFVLLRDVQPGVDGFHLSLRFDPQVVRIVDADGNAANGTQIAPAAFVNGPPKVIENQVDNVAGNVSLTVLQNGGTPVHGTSSWHKVATLNWAGQRQGNSVVAIGSASHFMTPAGKELHRMQYTMAPCLRALRVKSWAQSGCKGARRRAAPWSPVHWQPRA